MFSALNPGSRIHIIDKSNGLKYKIGEIVGTTRPRVDYVQPPLISLKVKIDNNTVDYPDVVSTASVATYNGGSVVIAETEDIIQNEIRSIISCNEQTISNIDSLRQQIKDGKEILKRLNPQFAKDEERDDRINALDDKVTGMQSTLDKILTQISNITTK